MGQTIKELKNTLSELIADKEFYRDMEDYTSAEYYSWMAGQVEQQLREIDQQINDDYRILIIDNEEEAQC